MGIQVFSTSMPRRYQRRRIGGFRAQDIEIHPLADEILQALYLRRDKDMQF
jgi:hypothetical protein